MKMCAAGLSICQTALSVVLVVSAESGLSDLILLLMLFTISIMILFKSILTPRATVGLVTPSAAWQTSYI